jgi:transposase
MSQCKVADKTRLSDQEWEVIAAQRNTIGGIHNSQSTGCRRCIDAVLGGLRVGGQWRSLPADRGHWNRVFKRFSRWSALGVWDRLRGFQANAADRQAVSIASTIARAHACAAGAAQSCADDAALGRSRGGFGCKIHAAVDGLGLPIKFILTGGQAADIGQAIPLMEGLAAHAGLADKGYDCDAFPAWLQAHGITAVIPPKANRKEQRECDWWHYKERHVVECMFGKLKYYRRLAMRYEKKALNFMGMLTFAGVLLWLR